MSGTCAAISGLIAAAFGGETTIESFAELAMVIRWSPDNALLEIRAGTKAVGREPRTLDRGSLPYAGFFGHGPIGCYLIRFEGCDLSPQRAGTPSDCSLSTPGASARQTQPGVRLWDTRKRVPSTFSLLEMT